MEEILRQSTEKGVSYNTYRQQLSSALKQIDVQADPLATYRKLNDTRMDRLDKTIVIDLATAQRLQGLKTHYTWLIISEGWCGDAAQIVPVLNKMAKHSPFIDVKILYRDDNEDLMNLFLTHGTKSIPKLIIVDSKGSFVSSWGPRPAGATDLISRYKVEKGVIDEQAKSDLQKWYLQDKGQSIMAEVLQLMGL